MGMVVLFPTYFLSVSMNIGLVVTVYALLIVIWASMVVVVLLLSLRLC